VGAAAGIFVVKRQLLASRQCALNDLLHYRSGVGVAEPIGNDLVVSPVFQRRRPQRHETLVVCRERVLAE
jgi:hypothetical protein